jgi:hypothetical protein
MSESFLARWSRRKHRGSDGERDGHVATPDSELETGATPQSGSIADNSQPVPCGESAASEAAFDATKLPPIESIGPASDISAFLAPGVPRELTRAALRRAWSADPKIRDFIGLSENSGDFNTPGAMAGFGPLEMTEEMRREIVRLVGTNMTDEGKEQESPAEPSAVPDEKLSPASLEEAPAGDAELTGKCEVLDSTNGATDLSQCSNGQPPASGKPFSTAPRAHGGALPK